VGRPPGDAAAPPHRRGASADDCERGLAIIFDLSDDELRDGVRAQPTGTIQVEYLDELAHWSRDGQYRTTRNLAVVAIGVPVVSVVVSVLINVTAPADPPAVIPSQPVPSSQ
jgi:hypothetical protein